MIVKISLSIFSYSDSNYYCVNYNQETKYVWKTCRSGQSWVPWVSVQLACNSTGDLLRCDDSDGVQMESHEFESEQCDSVGDFYCDLASDSWKNKE